MTGNYDGVAISYSPIDLHAHCIQDKLPAFMNLMSALGAQGRFVDAIDNGLVVLDQLGEPIKKNVTQEDYAFEFLKTSSLLQAAAMQLRASNTSSVSSNQQWEASAADAILQAPVMRNKEKEWAVRLMNWLSRTAYQENQWLLGSLLHRALQITLLHGVCPDSVSLFASYGWQLCKRGQIDEGYRFGKLTLSLLERFGGVDRDLPRVFCVVYTCVNCYIDPLQSILPELRHGYEIAMRSGNIEWAMILSRRMSPALLTCTPNLKSAVEELQGYVYQMKLHNHFVLNGTLPVLQMMLILMGDGGDDPTRLSGEAMNEEQALEEATAKEKDITIIDINSIRLKLMYLFGAYDEAGVLVKQVIALKKKWPVRSHEIIFDEIVYNGLVAAVLGRSKPHEANEWAGIADDAAKSLEHLSVHSQWNWAHKAALLNAEIAYYLHDDTVAAIKYYMEAIELAGKHKFIGDHALALERMAIFCSATEQYEKAQTYFLKAETAYRDWGATRKAGAITSTCSSTSSRFP